MAWVLNPLAAWKQSKIAEREDIVQTLQTEQDAIAKEIETREKNITRLTVEFQNVDKRRQPKKYRELAMRLGKADAELKSFRDRKAAIGGCATQLASRQREEKVRTALVQSQKYISKSKKKMDGLPGVDELLDAYANEEEDAAEDDIAYDRVNEIAHDRATTLGRGATSTDMCDDEFLEDIEARFGAHNLEEEEEETEEVPATSTTTTQPMDMPVFPGAGTSTPTAAEEASGDNDASIDDDLLKRLESLKNDTTSQTAVRTT